MSSVFRVVEHVIPGQHIRGYHAALKTYQEDVLHIAIKQYIPRDVGSNFPPNAVTVIGTHGNGFPKETYEPYMEAVYKRLQSKNVPVRAIWMADCSHQGASGVLNEHKQGFMTDYFDHSRDLLHMINHFRDLMPRPLIGVAHSLGCSQLVHLTTMHPRLLSTLILCEPVILDMEAGKPAMGINPSLPSTRRRDYWASRAEAETRLRKAFKDWNTAALDRYLQYGLRQLPTPLYDPEQDPSGTLSPEGVTLTTSKHQESWTFTQINFEPVDEKLDLLLRPDQDDVFQRKSLGARGECQIAMEELPNVRPSVLFVFGGKSYLSPPDAQARKLEITGAGLGGSGGAKAGKVKKVVFPDAGHLLPFEEGAMQEYADCSADWIGDWFEQWLKDEKIISEWKHRSTDKDMLRMSDEHLDAVTQLISTPRPYVPKPKPAKKEKHRGRQEKL